MPTGSPLVQEIDKLVRRDRRFPVQAYLFVFEALKFTLDRLGKKESDPEPLRHVTGQELTLGIKDYAFRQYGPMSKLVFENWGIRETLDFGRIVYNLIEAGLMGKSGSDRIEDFGEVFDFEEVLVRNYPFKVNRRKG